MLKLFRKKKKVKLTDYEGNILKVGDRVESLRYEMGECIIIEGENGPEYESVETKKRVSYAKMIDAHTISQKVKKIF